MSYIYWHYIINNYNWGIIGAQKDTQKDLPKGSQEQKKKEFSDHVLTTIGVGHKGFSEAAALWEPDFVKFYPNGHSHL